ncbi:hypothetical protein ACFQ6Q_00500 [Streptomyces sp. NPDC056437]|uniref:hypothetical protein n=1 Tax=Streptomyces sp. NPDC056437 TaxID=3345816 RepID=UPI0036BCA8DC
MAATTYSQLLRDVTALQKGVIRDAEGTRAASAWIDDEAKDTARVAEMIGGMRVDPDTVSETRDLSKIMQGVSSAAISYASAADTTAKSAQAVYDQARASHHGVNEAIGRAAVDNIHDVDREWFRQE